MQRFFFDLTNDEQTIRDEVGVEAAGLEVALDQAWSVIKEIADEHGTRESTNSWTLIVRDVTGTVVGRLPLS